MKKRKITKSILQSLESGDLIDLAESCDLFVPPNFSRAFLIEELLELDMGIESLPISKIPLDSIESLPVSYNRTEITLLLRDPMWCFAFWDVNRTELEKIALEEPLQLFLRLLSFKSEGDDEFSSYEDIDISMEESSIYVNTSMCEEVTQVALCYRTKIKTEILAKSNFIYLPRKDIKARLTVEEDKIDDVMELSGLKHLKLWHFQHFKNLFTQDE